jgi:putative sterol carrier protein
MAKFGTIEVYQELANLLNEDSVWAEKGKDINHAMVFDYGDPISKAFFVRFEHGKLTDIRELPSADAEPADFVMSGAPDSWRGMLEGSLTPTAALTSGRLKCKGNMMKLLREMKAFSHIMGSMSSIELT